MPVESWRRSAAARGRADRVLCGNELDADCLSWWASSDCVAAQEKRRHRWRSRCDLQRAPCCAAAKATKHSPISGTPTDAPERLPADVNQVDETRLVWAFLSDAEHPERVVAGSIIVAGDSEEPFLARVVDLVDGPGGETVVHLEVLGVPDQAIDELRHAGLLPASQSGPWRALRGYADAVGCSPRMKRMRPSSGIRVRRPSLIAGSPAVPSESRY